MRAVNRSTSTLAARLKMARSARGLAQADLAKAAGMKQADISKIETGRILQTTGIARLAAALGVHAEWLELGHGPTPDWNSVQEPSPTPWSGVGLQELSQNLRQSRFTLAPVVTWSSILEIELPPEFVVAAPDDSMWPRVKAGKLLRFATGLSPTPGDGILVADQAGGVHFRQYRQRRPGSWQAYPLNAAYQELDAQADGLRVLAVLIAEEGRWAG